MRFLPKDPNIASIMWQIDHDLITLQPEFQRGEVWSASKKQRLIDTIIRDWHIPPIHLVEKDDGKFDVLDGQQRLLAIRDFVRGTFAIDGSTEPRSRFIQELSGLRYGELPPKVKNKFDNFSIRVFELVDYEPTEPHELFFRLNQPTNLTEAEKRNAFIGGPRNEVKELVEWATNEGMEYSRVGFSNARMAYDDLLARFLITLEQGTLLEKVTAARITARYRVDIPFSENVLDTAKTSIAFVLGLPFLGTTEERLKPNKATIHTWLCMSAKLHRAGLLDELGNRLSDTIYEIERSRFNEISPKDASQLAVLRIFHDRSTSRVADTSSVTLRDLTAWIILCTSESHPFGKAQFLDSVADAWKLAKRTMPSQVERELSSWVTRKQWGGGEWL